MAAALNTVLALIGEFPALNLAYSRRKRKRWPAKGFVFYLPKTWEINRKAECRITGRQVQKQESMSTKKQSYGKFAIVATLNANGSVEGSLVGCGIRPNQPNLSAASG